MKKAIYSILSVFFIVMLAACGSSNSWEGEWVPENDRNSCNVIHILSGGKVEMINDSNEGYAKIEGKWTLTGDNDETIVINFDSNSIEVDFDNPLVAVVIVQGMQALADCNLEFGLSDDGNSLLIRPSNSVAFVRK